MIKSVLLVAACVCFGLGIAMPFVVLERYYFLTEAPSLLEIIVGIWNEGDYFLSAIVAAFSILFPTGKLLSVQYAAIANKKLPAWLSVVGKWSLMDVMLVAIVIFAAKTSGLASVYTQPGLWCYAASTLLTALAASKFADQ